jgi:hypothetical protein
MDQRGIQQTDLLPVFGSRGVASEVLGGKREPASVMDAMPPARGAHPQTGGILRHAGGAFSISREMLALSHSVGCKLASPVA